jgi:hypothetical protein
MVQTDSKVAVLLACSNPECTRYGKQLPFYLKGTDLTQMAEEENRHVIMCPACRQTRMLTSVEKDGLRKLLAATRAERASA